jgi:hypothetical protein
MKGMLIGLFMTLVLSSFVFAASSEVVYDFSVDISTGEVSKYVPPKTFVGYLGYIVLTFIVLVFVYFSFGKKGSARTSVPSRKRTKVASSSGRKKKVSKSKK